MVGRTICYCPPVRLLNVVSSDWRHNIEPREGMLQQVWCNRRKRTWNISASMVWQTFVLLYSTYTFISNSMVFITKSMVWIYARHSCRNMQQHDLEMLDKPTNPGAPITQAHMVHSLLHEARNLMPFVGHASDSFNRSHRRNTKYQLRHLVSWK